MTRPPVDICLELIGRALNSSYSNDDNKISTIISAIICELRKRKENLADFFSDYLRDYLRYYLGENRSRVTGL